MMGITYLECLKFIFFMSAYFVRLLFKYAGRF
jgi:hypothetical protein